jgi:hypothetical protein
LKVLLSTYHAIFFLIDPGTKGDLMSWFDYFVRLLPALAVIGGLIGARMQLAENRRQNSIAIAKNYYREMLELFQNNTDILYAGINEEAMSRLEEDLANYRRYRLLFTNMIFALQEVYLALDIDHNEHWRNTVSNFVLLFKYFIISEVRFTAGMRATLDDRFLAYVMAVVAKAEHPLAQDVRVQPISGKS